MQSKLRWMTWGASLALLLACAGEASDPADEAREALGRSQQALSATSDKPGSSKDNAYTLFEAGPVRPVAVSASGLVAVTNIPDDRIELFRPSSVWQGSDDLEHCGSVHVGLRPVAVAAVGNREFWVANHLSDSVSVVRVGLDCRARVVRTLQVGDEPRDIVSARSSTGHRYAFVTTAHRGQNVKNPDGTYRDPELSTPGLGRADVFVFDADDRDSEEPLEILTLFTDTPRALAVGDDRVYAAGFFSGNRTSIVKFQFVVGKGRASLQALDANGDFVIDESLPPEARVIEGGYPALSGYGRCISAATSSPPGQPLGSDFFMDVCVQTDPADPRRALSIVPQVEGAVTPECACTSASGELQVTPPVIVRFFDSQAECGSSFDAQLGGCWLEPAVGPHGPQSSPVPLSQAWNDEIAFSLPDRDVFSIDLSQHPPALVAGGDFREVGTTLFNMAVHPKTGKVYVSNTEARNHVRFEGPGEGVSTADGFANSSVRGHIAESRISVLDPGNGSILPVHLNDHIDRSECCQAEPNAETERSLAFPLGMAITHKRRFGHLREDQDLYVAAFGSDKVAVLSTEELEAATPGVPFQDQGDHIEVPGGPAGLALDEYRDRLYVLSRFSNELVVIDTDTRDILETHSMHSPEPDRVIEGRRFLYDARSTSSHGDSACASCHVFGDFDGLSWDLGAPDEETLENEGPFMAEMEILAAPLSNHFLSVKGPMNTQSLRGLDNHGSMHWRGDRRGGPDSEQPNGGAFDEQAAFKAFNVAFPGLNGRSTQLTEEQMQAFTDFALDITYPPNPIRNLDDVLTPHQEGALDTYVGCEATQESMARGECLDGRNLEQEQLNCFCAVTPRFALGIEPLPEECPQNPVCTLNLSDSLQTCNGCHTLDPTANAEFGIDHPGFFGSNNRYSSDGVAHVMKVPHFRNMYQKVGMFGTVQTPFGIGLSDLPDSVFGPRNGGLFALANAFTGDQIRGFGYTHAGEEDTMFHFMASFAFVKNLSFGPPLVGNNLGGFELFLPEDRAACFDGQLGPLNDTFLSALAPTETLDELRAHLLVTRDPTATPEQVAAAQFALESFVASLPPENPGAVFQQAGAAQLALPLLDCPSLPDAAALEAQGCFELGFPLTCPQVFTVRTCAAWGSTLEQLLESDVQACEPEGLKDRREVEDFLFAFDSNLKPIVGQQVTLRLGASQAKLDRLELLLSQARQGNCDVVAHSGRRGALYDGSEFLLADGRRFPVSRLTTRRVPVTFTAVPPGEGFRSGLDRDNDGEPDQL